MDIYRHKITIEEFEYNTSSAHYEDFSKMLNNLGFCLLDGSDIKIPQSYNYGQIFKWSKDSIPECQMTYIPGGYNSGIHYTNVQTLGVSSFSHNFLSRASILNNYMQIIFIPLKNNGFLLEFNGSSIENNELRSLTPKFRTYSYGGYNLDSTLRTTYLIGIPNNISSINTYFYLFFDNGGKYPIGSDLSPYIGFKDGEIILTSIPNVDTSANLDYVNKNANICTLIPYPYENSFIDGLYLATTIPDNDIEGKFFSFGGRNYLGVYKNLVVELLPN